MNTASAAENLAPQPTEGWQTMPCTLDGGAAARAGIGLIALANDITSEPELTAMLPREGVGLYANRIEMAKEVTVKTLGDMERDLASVAANLVPDAGLDVIAFGCTSGTMVIGEDAVAARIHETRPEVKCTNPITASLKGLARIGCSRVAILTPYIDEINMEVERYFTTRGLDVVAKGSFKQFGDLEMCRVPPDAIYEAGLALGRSDAEALFISCTALRVSSVLGPLEAALGKPVVASNQALTWDCLRLAGYSEPVNGFGRLLTL